MRLLGQGEGPAEHARVLAVHFKVFWVYAQPPSHLTHPKAMDRGLRFLKLVVT